MSKKLEEIRRKIDTLDNQIHDLLMQRAELIVDVSEEKRRSRLQIIQPAREAVMIRRLLGRHEGKLPRAAIVRIWRELVGAVSLLQTGLKVAVCAPEGKQNTWDQARDYFGSVLPMTRVSNPLAAISMVREEEVTFAVVPWPVDGDENPWWHYLASGGDRPMRIVVRLPYGDVRTESPDTESMALIVARITYDETGDDQSFVALEISQSISRGRVVEQANKAGFTPVSMYSRKCPNHSMPSLHLLVVDGYVAPDDARLRTLLDKLEDRDGRATCIGGYPRPPLYETIDDLTGARKQQG
ncbi:MAG: chorismate mutase [Alphaproteobacteria bacterium]|nr:chorismate mutase [Alphaproteobacteria bacterium]